MKCRSCGGENLKKNGHNKLGQQQYVCRDCGRCLVFDLRGPSVRAPAGCVSLTSWKKIMLRIELYFPHGGGAELSTVDPLHDSRPLFENHRVKGHRI